MFRYCGGVLVVSCQKGGESSGKFEPVKCTDKARNTVVVVIVAVYVVICQRDRIFQRVAGVEQGVNVRGRGVGGGPIRHHCLCRQFILTRIDKPDLSGGNVFYCGDSAVSYTRPACPGEFYPESLKVNKVYQTAVQLCEVVGSLQVGGNLVVNGPGPVKNIRAVYRVAVEPGALAPLQTGFLAHNALTGVKVFK